MEPLSPFSRTNEDAIYQKIAEERKKGEK